MKYCENRHKCNHCERIVKVEIIVVIANEFKSRDNCNYCEWILKVDLYINVIIANEY